MTGTTIERCRSLFAPDYETFPSSAILIPWTSGRASSRPWFKPSVVLAGGLFAAWMLLGVLTAINSGLKQEAAQQEERSSAKATVARAVSIVSKHIIDEASARFYGVQIGRIGSFEVVCGEVSSPNNLGTYDKRTKWFVLSGFETAYFVTRENEEADLASWHQWCGR